MAAETTDHIPFWGRYGFRYVFVSLILTGGMYQIYIWAVGPGMMIINMIGLDQQTDGVAVARQMFGPFILQTACIDSSERWQRDPGDALVAWGAIESFHRVQLVVAILWFFVLVFGYRFFSGFRVLRSSSGPTKAVEPTGSATTRR